MSLRVTAVLGVAIPLAFLVGRDGSPVWQAVRVLEVIVLAALAAVVILRLGSGWRSPTLLTVGVVGTAVGLGLAPAWINKAGITAVSAAAVLALVAGLAALGYGLIDLGRAIKGWLRWAAAAVALLVSAVLFLTLALAVAATNVPRTALGEETPADWGLAFEEAVLVADDGVALSGWYLPSTNRAAVVVLHGAGSTRSSALQHAVILARRGYGVLLFDARGHGASGGRAMDFGWFGDSDLAAALDYLERRPDVDPDRLAALGLSMGGEQAIGAAAADRRLRGVVAEGATGRTADDRAWLPAAYGFRGWVQQRVDDLTY